jgi:N-carbamoylputrescine amidase
MEGRTPQGHREVRVIRIAGLQLAPHPGVIAANLEHATTWVEEAARRRAQLVVLPELYSSGYFLTRDIWDSAEPSDGPTVRWLKSTARRLSIYLGSGFLAVEGDHFINTFVLCGPDGEVSGLVKKRNAEAYFFMRVHSSAHIIDTRLGRIGVGICADTHMVFLPLLMQKMAVDIALLPHAWPAVTRASRFVSEDDIAQFHAKARGMAPLYTQLLGVPALFVNQVGPAGAGPGPRPGIVLKMFKHGNHSLVGLSCIVDSDGEIKAELGSTEEGMVIADVTLDPALKACAKPASYGGWVHPVSAITRRLIFPIDIVLGKLSYTFSAERKRKARRISRMR